ncbi:aromatic ring-hydroxylating dioxygenase subunit alpha [Amycolatopsis sp. NPDC048633]|uniref:aromatic ring-hydroxylating dioxygenase subunit alpha n=1 Tax=Amycolatopsis sp. NPDC048633 TaxID=3157095 RepID=UPI0033DC363C
MTDVMPPVDDEQVRPARRQATVGGPGRRDWSTWPRYEKAALGFREYWYPVAWSRKIGKKPRAIQVLGEKIMLIRDGGEVRALHDRCPHRGVPLSHKMSSQEFPGTWSCCYHGWTFDLETGVLVAAITDGPESPICGKVTVRTYPVEEARGLVWVWLGDGPARPFADDVPEELLDPDAVVVGRITVRDGNWRFGAENGFDDGHAKWLHRNALWTKRVKMPVWSEMKVIRDGPWITRRKDKMHYSASFPGLGDFPKKSWYRRREGNKTKVSLRLPGTLRVKYAEWSHFEWWVAATAEDHTYVQLAVMNQGKWRNRRFWFYYWTWARWVFHGMFNDEDRLMVEVTDAPPERLYRPDVSLTEWRRMVEEEARRGPVEEVKERQAEKRRAKHD